MQAQVQPARLENSSIFLKLLLDSQHKTVWAEEGDPKDQTPLLYILIKIICNLLNCIMWITSNQSLDRLPSLKTACALCTHTPAVWFSLGMTRPSATGTQWKVSQLCLDQRNVEFHKYETDGISGAIFLHFSSLLINWFFFFLIHF